MGIDPLSIFHEKNLVVSKGDVIVLYTDGVTDAANSKGERYGVDRLREMIKKSADDDATTISESIVRDAQEFAGSAAIKDDITVLVCKVLQQTAKGGE